MGWRITLSEQAEADLQAIVEFIARQNPGVAERIGTELVDLIFSLDELPRRGVAVKARPGLRKLSHRHCLIYYRLSESIHLVEVVRLWDGRRNPATLFPPPPDPTQG
jgi:plasmid stabilization system protein ParE